ncbi:hypothetical protein ACLKA6_014241 [Drosophila palustris]
MWHEICAALQPTVASCWAGFPQFSCGIHMWLLSLEPGGQHCTGSGVNGGFYFCINSNKHDNEMTTEMSD